MVNVDEFRTGQFSVPFAGAGELPPCCFSCIYLQHEECPVCFSDAPFYYICAYSWPDKLTQTPPPCLQEPPA
jgi:hypothetical protein